MKFVKRQNVNFGGAQMAIKKKKKVWGSEIWMVNCEKYCGKILNLKKGYRCSLHQHFIKDESFFILEGKVLMQIVDVIKTMNVNDVVHIPPRTIHRFTGLEDSKIIEISTQHFEEDSYRLTESGKVEI